MVGLWVSDISLKIIHSPTVFELSVIYWMEGRHAALKMGWKKWFIAAVFMVANTLKIIPITTHIKRKLWYIYIIEYYSTIKKKKLQIHTKT